MHSDGRTVTRQFRLRGFRLRVYKLCTSMAFLGLLFWIVVGSVFQLKVQMSFAHWQRRSQWGLSEVQLLLVKEKKFRWWKHTVRCVCSKLCWTSMLGPNTGNAASWLKLWAFGSGHLLSHWTRLCHDQPPALVSHIFKSIIILFTENMMRVK